MQFGCGFAKPGTAHIPTPAWMVHLRFQTSLPVSTTDYRHSVKEESVNKVRAVDKETDNFLGSIQHVGETNVWTAELQIDGHPSTFKLDTRAAVSVVGEELTADVIFNPATRC
ncbi:hypothetical protein ElyMa_001292200 [Elysia marginata]|uniref:Uncharacterized protein n=1 Tax=Elysia marginata TaxID=1093978 RepID=A0AAV4IGE7_9GAST|nr:hypothetical protein ElyMa_001292200 [Elysia marginata]